MELETLQAATSDRIWEALRSRVKHGRPRSIPVEEAVGCVLVTDARSAHDFPPFDRATTEGFAVRVSDFGAAPMRFKISGRIRAGESWGGSLESGACVGVGAGAPLPTEADAIVPRSESREIEGGFVEFDQIPAAGQNIDRRASMIKASDLLLRAGTRINGSALAALVAAGISRVEVFTRPRVALLTTGYELVEHGRKLEEGQIHDSNSTALEEYIRIAGGEVIMFGRCPDTTSALRASLELGLANDFLCVVGGMSSSKHDLVPKLLEELGVKWLTLGTQLTPVNSLRIGQTEAGCWVIGLPGNPIGCAVGFFLFARVILDGLQGLPVGRPAHLVGLLDTDIPAGEELPIYHPAVWSVDDKGSLHVSPLIWRGLGDPFGMAIANALIFRAAGAPAAPRGEAVHFIALELPR